MPQRMLCVSIAIALLSGCGSHEQPAANESRAPTVIDPLLQQRDHAREQAEAAVEQRRQQLDAVESQER